MSGTKFHSQVPDNCDVNYQETDLEFVLWCTRLLWGPSFLFLSQLILFLSALNKFADTYSGRVSLFKKYEDCLFAFRVWVKNHIEASIRNAGKGGISQYGRCKNMWKMLVSMFVEERLHRWKNILDMSKKFRRFPFWENISFRVGLFIAFLIELILLLLHSVQ